MPVLAGDLTRCGAHCLRLSDHGTGATNHIGHAPGGQRGAAYGMDRETMGGGVRMPVPRKNGGLLRLFGFVLGLDLAFIFWPDLLDPLRKLPLPLQILTMWVLAALLYRYFVKSGD
jgi:hypothetical protein